MAGDLFAGLWVVDRVGVLLAYTLGGVALGTVSGLVPGIHANAFALLLAATAPTLSGPSAGVAVAVLAAGVTHTFLDVVPALALGVPDAAMAAGSLPGHRLVLGGRGREALRLSALGSGGALLCALPVAVPLTALVRRHESLLSTSLPFLLVGVFVLLVLAERRPWRMVAAAFLVLLSGALGLATLDRPFDGFVAVGGVLTPLFGGLFGVPVLVDAARGSGVPTQDGVELATRPSAVGRAAVAGVAGGGLVGYLPGVSAGVAATLALPFAGREDPDRTYVVATSGANTATAVFALFSLVALDAPRTGVTVALRAVGPPPLATLLTATVVAGVVSAVLVPVLGDRYLAAAGQVGPRTTSLVACGLLCLLSGLFAGVGGVVVLAAAGVVGLLPVRLGVRRVHLMGVLAVPLVVG
ncbi:tripartite tricarboxylate transporter permease [Salinigranum halophilum]|jgi:putative membrane protein|uniref:tripartite tricarboxylate transporter permease n=1 Tax=Salinigranum halophilum TaxID=2565931 RepID=UPI00115EA2D6|nr:tripartite tricarboxylate transporter permease [Salinigranum halophilum]